MVMTSTHLGLITGLVLGLAGAFGGFGALVLVLGLVGLLVGRYLDGTLDVSRWGGRMGMSGRDGGRGL